MKTIKSKDFTAKRAWDAIYVANMNGVTTRLHWTDQPYKWHTNDGEEVFAVLDGAVEMRYREKGIQKRIQFETGDVFFPKSAANTSLIRLAKRAFWSSKKKAAFERL